MSVVKVGILNSNALYWSETDSDTNSWKTMPGKAASHSIQNECAGVLDWDFWLVWYTLIPLDWFCRGPEELYVGVTHGAPL